jgi:hypothetical protein
MQLAEFILKNIEPIAREWEEFARTCTPAAVGMTESALLDDITQILDAVVDDMEQPQTLAEQATKGEGSAVERFTQRCRPVSHWLAHRIAIRSGADTFGIPRSARQCVAPMV